MTDAEKRLRNFAASKYAGWEDLEIVLAELERLKRWPGACETVRGWYPDTMFPPDSTTMDANSAKWARHVCDLIREEAERERD